MKQKQGFESLLDHITDPPLKDAVLQIIETLDRKINKTLKKILNKFKTTESDNKLKRNKNGHSTSI
jgi:hypothetical protein